jgi:hypothetical protein
MSAHLARLHAWVPAAAGMLAAMLSAVPALAQSKTGTAMGQFLLIEPSARTAAMGNAGVALAGGLDGVYFNPAAIAGTDRFGVFFTHSDWLAGIAYDYVAVAVPAGGGGSAYAAITALNSGEIDVRTVDQPLGTGEKFTASDVAIGVGYGRRLTDRFSAGGQITYVQETIWHSSASTFTLSMGTHYRVSENGFQIGASLANFGTHSGYDGRDLRVTYDNDPGRYGDNGALPAESFTGDFPVPTMFRIGAGMPFRLSQDVRLHVEMDAYHPSDNSENMSFGAEMTIGGQMAFRAGCQNLIQNLFPRLFPEDSEVGVTLGAGLMETYESARYRLDYAWADQGRLRFTQRISLGVVF